MTTKKLASIMVSFTKQELYCFAFILVLAAYMQWSTGLPVMFKHNKRQKEGFVGIKTMSDDDAWKHDIYQLRKMLKATVEKFYAGDAPLTNTRSDIMDKIDTMHRWASSKYTPETLTRLQSTTDIHYKVQSDGKLVITELGNKKEATMVI